MCRALGRHVTHTSRRATGELEVDVLERRPHDVQVVELDAMLDCPARQAVEGGGEVLGDEVDEPVGGSVVGYVIGQSCSRWQPEADPGASLVTAADSRGRAFGDYPAGGDDGYAVGQELRLVHVVRGEQHRLAQFGQVFHDLPGLAPGRGVEAGRGLVQEKQLRVADEGNAYV